MGALFFLYINFAPKKRDVIYIETIHIYNYNDQVNNIFLANFISVSSSFSFDVFWMTYLKRDPTLARLRLGLGMRIAMRVWIEIE